MTIPGSGQPSVQRHAAEVDIDHETVQWPPVMRDRDSHETVTFSTQAVENSVEKMKRMSPRPHTGVGVSRLTKIWTNAIFAIIFN